MLSCKRSKFSLPDNITYLNCAYMSPLLKRVEKAGINGLRLKRNPGQIKAEDFFIQSTALRNTFGHLIDAPDERIAIVPSASYGIATAAANITIEKGQNIVVAAGQFPSNYYVWSRLCSEQSASLIAVAPPDTLKDRGKTWNERILEAITTRTKVVAIAHTHWADGTRFNLEKIRKRTRDVGALLIIDGTQSVGAMPFDFDAIQPDALICAGYKWLLGPYSLGLGYYGEYFNEGKPIEENWITRLASDDFAALVNYNAEYQPGAMRFDMGERSNFILVPMLLKALGQIARWGIKNIQEYCLSISQETIAKLGEKGYWIEETAYRGGHIFGIRLPKGIDVEKVKLSLQKNKVYVSFRGNAIRVSPYVYNDATDLRKLTRILMRA